MKPLKLEDLAEPLRSRVLAALEKQTRLARPAILEVQPIPMQPPELSEAHKANSHPRKFNKTKTRVLAALAENRAMRSRASVPASDHAALQGPQNAPIGGCEHLPGVLEPRPIPTPPPEPATRFRGVLTHVALNKTETRFFRDWPPGTSGLILAQALTLPFGDGTSYRPDFVLVTDGRVVAYEVKGGHVGKVAWSRHGIERFRRARERFREIAFELWIWKDHQWRKL